MENDKYIGRLLGGRYELIDVVGVGGMAVVYRARDTVLGRYVAIKILKEEFARDPDIRRRFAIESRAVAKLSHHNIVSIFDVGNEDGTDYIVMELIEGVTLKEYLQQKGRLSWQESVFFAEQISSALLHAHSRGIIHQDIKPQNVIILRDGTAKLTDFGIASFATTQETRVVQEAIGSVHYISPEQAKGSKIDYRTDIYSLGVVMYEMLTGKLPFEGETALQIVMQHINTVPVPPSELVPDIPKGLDEIVMHAMCANISRRYASADELYADLVRVREDPTVEFYYAAPDDSSGETQVIGREVQRAARHAAAEEQVYQAAPRHRETAERRTTGREAPSRRRTSVRGRESTDFFEKLSERPAMAAGMAVAVVAVISLLVVAVLMFTGGSKSAKIDVPDLIGRTIDDVYADSDVMSNFEIKEASSRQESDRPAGEILDQDPGEGQQAVKGSVITVTVSAGGDNVKDTYKVVDFTGKSLDYVAASLDAHGIELKKEKEYSDDVDEGKVIRTDPEAGTELARGATLTVYISLGKEQKSTDVPSLTGMTRDAAQQALSDRGLKLGSVDEVESDKPEGTVIWQSVDAKSTVDQGTTVNIQISKGKKKTEDPAQNGGNTTGGTTNGGDDDTPGKLPPAPSEGSATIPVALPDSADTAHVVIYVDGVIQYDDTPSTSQGSIAVTVQSTAGDHEVTVSVDGSSTTQTYSFN